MGAGEEWISLRASSDSESTCEPLRVRAQGGQLLGPEESWPAVCVSVCLCVGETARGFSVRESYGQNQQVGRLGSRSSYWAG